MWYKGGDLDLRAPYAHLPREPAGGEDGSQPGWRWPPPEPGRGGPILVDQTVLACCNGAYDAALFYGARDVRVEHLLHAMTRVDAAREVLDQHGLDTHHLRRDTAVAIASEAPASGTVSGVRPRTAAELDDLLHRAAARAGHDNVAASVHDLLRAALSYGREASATAMLLRAAADPQQLERWGAEPSVPLHGGAFAASLAAALLPDAWERLAARLDQIEAAMRTLAAEVAADRKAMLDRMGEMQHDWHVVRAHSATSEPAVADVQARLGELGRSVDGLAERFEAIRVFSPGDGAADLAGRLSALEARLAAQPAAIAEAVAYMLSEGHAGADDGSQAAAEGRPPGTSAVAGRLAGLEEMLRTQSDRVEEAGKAHERELGEVYEALVKLGTNQQTLAGNLEAWRLDSSGDVSIVSNRLASLERTLQEALARPGPARLAADRGDGHGSGVKRWLSRTGRVLPASWRADVAALRESLRRPRPR